ncbi:MAG TPA: peptidylprolyl isomerase [Pseudomonadales bacterium]|nr:peptidylprolyl isomerase [Pseudomonadales bacterium]
MTMRLRCLAACCLLLPVLMLCACHKPSGRDALSGNAGALHPAGQDEDQPPDSEIVIADVNGTPIHADEVDYWYRAAHGERLTPEMKESALDQLIDQELVFQAGKSLGLDDRTYREKIRGLELKLETLKRSEMMSRVIAHEIAPKISVTEADARQYFKAHHDRIETRLRLRIWRFQDQAQAKAILAMLRAGQPGPKNAYVRGPLPWIEIPIGWRDIVYALKPGEFSDVFDSEKSGILVFQLLDTEKAKPIRFNDIRYTIMSQLKEQQVRTAVTRYIAELRAHAHIRRSHIEVDAAP